MVEGRRMAVLNAIVSDYVRTREPVASRALAERYCSRGFTSHYP